MSDTRYWGNTPCVVAPICLRLRVLIRLWIISDCWNRAVIREPVPVQLLDGFVIFLAIDVKVDEFFFYNFTAFFDWQRKKAWQTFDQNISNKTSTVTNLWMHWLQCKVGFLTHDNSIIFIPVSYAGRCWSCWWLPSPSWPLSVSSLPRPTVIKTEC